MKIKKADIFKPIGGVVIEDEMVQGSLLHARQFPVEPIFDEDGELSGGIPDWEVVLPAMRELLAKPGDRLVIRFRCSEDHQLGQMEIGMVPGN